ncbi:ABC transporter ATP-binding protein [Niallia nealsonii]|uniref:Peptide ABC transporter ATP-binding protein n=1 Tax=Niallia nealsonii TaxID=115979 RepID=A0A2N0YY78_9BACI|nr:ABC transporter ATP-binding protein [Niallia nealsonii]PKG22217.1 peptide ABC transporter ATP-binding protein [Niallia nealsonii]
MIEKQPLLKIEDLKVNFSTFNGELSAIDGVSLELNTGEVLGIVGESGCGKSVTAEAILQLLDENISTYDGKILFNGANLLDYSSKEIEKLRGNEISMIFQDPMSSLNPVIPIGKQIAESIIIHQKISKKEAYKKAIELLELTGIPSPVQRAKEYPHEISGGMRQRVMIAIALACQPKLLIADEPTTALDVTIQSQILDLMMKFQKELNMGIILITHDFGVVANICTKVAVMYLGQVIEETDVNTLFSKPLHPYTFGLMESVPQLDGDRSQELSTIAGSVPSLYQIPKGCRFAPRCKYATEKCHVSMPILEQAKSNHKVRCWHYEKISERKTVYANQ